MMKLTAYRDDWAKRILATVASPFMVAGFAVVLAVTLLVTLFVAPFYFAFAEDPWTKKGDAEEA